MNLFQAQFNMLELLFVVGASSLGFGLLFIWMRSGYEREMLTLREQLSAERVRREQLEDWMRRNLNFPNDNGALRPAMG